MSTHLERQSLATRTVLVEARCMAGKRRARDMRTWLTSPNRRHRALRRLYSASPRLPATATSSPSALSAAWRSGKLVSIYLRDAMGYNAGVSISARD